MNAKQCFMDNNLISPLAYTSLVIHDFWSYMYIRGPWGKEKSYPLTKPTPIYGKFLRML